MNELVILVPVLRRPWRVQPLLDSIEAATPEPHRTLFIVNDDDTAELEALTAAGARTLVVPAERRSFACKINDGYAATTEPWLFTAADDLHFRDGWFTRALTWATDTTGVIGTNDLCNQRTMTGAHSTHSLVRRSYIEERSGVVDQPNIVLHEGYPHEFCDDELIQTAMTRGVFVHAFDSIVEHLHPNVGKAEDDEIRGGDVLPLGRRALRRHVSSSRRSRRCASMRLPASSTM